MLERVADVEIVVVDVDHAGVVVVHQMALALKVLQVTFPAEALVALMLYLPSNLTAVINWLLSIPGICSPECLFC